MHFKFLQLKSAVMPTLFWEKLKILVSKQILRMAWRESETCILGDIGLLLWSVNRLIAIIPVVRFNLTFFQKQHS